MVSGAGPSGWGGFPRFLVGLELWAKIPEAIINGDGDLTVAISDFLTKPVPKPGEHPQETLPGHKARAKVRFDAAVDK